MVNHPQKPTQQDFLEWRQPRRGRKNPEIMDNPFWIWSVHFRKSAYETNEILNGPDSMNAGPCWCFDRFGQSMVNLPDGRKVYIAGEHEDYYDPDFYIYNDVVVVEQNGKTTIYGYPESVFLPTDFHSATLSNNEIVLIGNLGYPDDRKYDQTQVFRLNTENWQMQRVKSTGENPGWIFKHKATLSGDEIIVTGGELCQKKGTVENIDDYKLCLTSHVWSRLTVRNWKRWVLKRADGNFNNLWEIRVANFDHEMGGVIDEEIEKLSSQISPDISEYCKPKKVNEEQMKLIRTLYQFPFSEKLAIEQEEDYGVFLYELDGVTVRFNEETDQITVTVEGQLPDKIVDVILSTLQQKLSRLENTSYQVVPI